MKRSKKTIYSLSLVDFFARTCMASFVWLAVSNATHGQQTSSAIDHLTEDVEVAVVANDLANFNKLFAEVCKAAQIPLAEKSLAGLFYYPLSDLGVEVDQAIDRQKSGGVVVLGNGLEQFILRYLYPVKDSSLIAEAIEIDSMEFKAGSAYKTKEYDVVMLERMMSIGTPLFGWPERRPTTPEPIENPFGEMRTVSHLFNDSDKTMFESADAVLMLGHEASTQLWGTALQPMLGIQPGTESDTWQRLRAAGEDLRFGLAAIDLDEGVHLRSKSFFKDMQDGPAIGLIRDVRGGDRASDLKHLPDANFLLAGSAVGDGKQNATLAQGIVKLIVDIASPGEEVLRSDDKQTFYDSFDAIWRNLQGTRIGLYRNEGEIGDQGELALVTIFEVTDPNALLGSLPELVKFANDGIRQTTPEGEQPDLKFEYLAEHKTFEDSAGDKVQVDILQIDTSRIGDENAERFRRFFGDQGNQIQFVALEKHVVMFLGANPSLLKTTIKNIRGNVAGLTEHPAIIAAEKKIDPRRKIEMHVSAVNFNNIRSAMIRGRKDLGRYQRPEAVTSVALVLEEDRFGLDLWMPMKELNRAAKLMMAFLL